MAFGLSAGDIAKGIELCKWIVDHCFDNANAAGMWFFNAVTKTYALYNH
jgi:hypothetical protein